MNINHHNYESWLLQYVDNELTPAEREAVEAFVAENPEAASLLGDFKQVVLQPDLSLTMPGKAQLFQPELWEPTNISKQQESLLLLADQALPAAEKEQLLKKIESSPLLQKEWSLLNKTILNKEVPAVMPGKEEMFRYPKVFPIGFKRLLRVAVAAATLGAGLFFADRYFENTGIEPGREMVQNLNVEEPSNPVNKPEISLDKKTEGAIVNTPDSFSNAAASTSQQIAGTKKQEPEAVHKKTATEIAEKKMVPREMPEQVLIAAVIPEPESRNNRETLLPHLNSGMQDGEPGTGITASIPDVDQFSNPAVEAEYEYTTTETILANEYNEEEETIHIAGARFNKQKLRNVYRNVTRPISRAFNRSADDRSDRK